MSKGIAALHEEFCQEALLANYQPATIAWWKQSLVMLRRHFPRQLRQVTDVTLERLHAYFWLSSKRAGGWTAETAGRESLESRARYTGRAREAIRG